MGGIFQFLIQLVAQTTLQHGPLGHDLSFSMVSNMIQALLWCTIPSSVNFHFLSDHLCYPSPPLHPLLTRFHGLRPTTWGLPLQPILGSLSLPAVCFSQSSWVCLKHTHWAIIKAALSKVGGRLPPHSCLDLARVSQPSSGFEGSYQHPHFHQHFICLFLVLLTNQIFTFSVSNLCSSVLSEESIKFSTHLQWWNAEKDSLIKNKSLPIFSDILGFIIQKSSIMPSMSLEPHYHSLPTYMP